MMISSSSTTQSTKKKPETPSNEGAKKAKATPKKASPKTGFVPKKYPKPTLAELAILVGIKPKQPQPITPPAEKTLPYELSWRENEAQLSLHAANQEFIATQIIRIQSHVVKPMPLPVLSQTTVETPPPIAVVVDAKPEAPAFIAENSLGIEEKTSSEQSLPEPIFSVPKNQVANSLSAVLGLVALEKPEDMPTLVLEADPCPTSVELEFETPIETQLASYLGVKYTSTTTISVAEPVASVSPPRLSEDKALLPIADYFSDALEAELAQQKAWLAAALAREKNKAYPSLSPLQTAKPPALALAMETMSVDESTLLPAEEAEPVAQPFSLPEDGVEVISSEVVAESPPPPSNDQDFAAVLDSLMEDFSSEEEVLLAVDEGLKETTLVETVAEPAEVEALESFEVVGLYAEEAETSQLPEREAEQEAVVLPTIVADLPPVTQSPQANNPFEEITTFNQLLKVTKPDTPMDFLLLGTYFLKQQEQKETFSLRQLNHLLSSVSKPNANHTVLELALAKHFITMMPDLTGTATATHYQLSKIGETAALRLFQTVTP